MKRGHRAAIADVLGDVQRSLDTFISDPADTAFQRDYQAGLERVQKYLQRALKAPAR